MSKPVKLFYKGEPIQVQGDNESGTTMVPLRAFAEALGHKVTWRPPDEVWLDGDPPVRPVPEGLTLSGEFFVIDAGHGGGDPGAVDGINPAEGDAISTKEAELNFLYAVKLASTLKALGAGVALTRTKQEEYLSPQQRAARANDRYPHATAFISWHNNSFKNASACGFEVLHYYTTGNSYRMAKSIVAQAKAAGIPLHGDGLVDGRKIVVLNSTDMSAILIEAGFISNPQEEINLHDQGYMERVIMAVVRGIVDVYGKKLQPQIDYRKFRHKGTDIHLAVVRNPQLKTAAADPGKRLNVAAVAKQYGAKLAITGGYSWHRKEDDTHWPVTPVIDNHVSVGKPGPLEVPRAALCQDVDGSLLIRKAQTPEELLIYKNALGAGPMLAVDGKRQIGHDEKFLADIMEGKNPRAAAGLIDEHTLVLVAVEGRTLTDAGLTLEDLADFLVAFGCKVVMNLDGGGSVNLWIDGKWIVKGRDIVNILMVL